MKLALLLVLLALLSSCASHSYSIATTGMQTRDYQIVNTCDSGITIVPQEYSNELTPEVIREYGRFASYDSLTLLQKIPTSGAKIGTVAGLTLGGAVIGGVIGLSTSHPVTYSKNDYLGLNTFTDFIDGVNRFLIGSLIGLCTGALVSYFAIPRAENLLPPPSADPSLRRGAIRKIIEEIEE